MSRLPSLPDSPHLIDVFKRFPRGVQPLLAFHDEVLRGESELSAAERELIAAYTSGLNACDFCHGSHRMIAEVHGIDPEVFEHLVNEPEKAGLAPKWLPLLAYLRKLTVSPSRVTDADAREVLEAGWSEDAFHNAILVCASFNMMNRIVEGCGVVPTNEGASEARSRHETLKASATPYQDFGRLLQGDSP
jgi:uncharacterized peroxidase-related enzyme